MTKTSHVTMSSPPPAMRVNFPEKLTVDDILNFIGFGPFQVIAFFLAGFSTLAFGFEVMVFAFIDLPIQNLWNLNGVQYAVLPAVTGVSNIVGGFLYGYLADRFGRVWPFVLALANVAVFSLASAFSPNFLILVLLRFCTSFGLTGVVSITFPMLIEFLPVPNRGKVVVIVFLIQALGNCITGGLAWWLVPSYKNGWRYLIMATAIPSFLVAIFRMLFYIQSPRYLIAKGEFTKARKVFSQMAAINRKNIDEILPKGTQFQDVVAIETETEPAETCDRSLLTFMTLFKPEYRRRTICLSIIYVTETVGFYGSSIFLPNVLRDLNVNPYFTAFIGFLGQIPGIMLMAIIVEWEHVGRLNSLRFFTLLTIGSFILFAFIRNQITIPVFTIFIYFSMYSIIPLLYTYMSECYPTNVRSLALSYFNNLSAFFGIFIPFLSGYLADTHNHWLYPVVWAGLFVLQFITALFLNYETLGRNLTDI